MNALVRKEVRLVLPAWGAAMALVVGAVFYASDAGIGLFFAVGTILLALLPFGHEFSLGTFSSMLVQPVPRQRLWRVKAQVLAVAMLSVFCTLLLTYGVRAALRGGMPAWQVALTGGLVSLTAYAGGLWTTLLLRQIAAAFWFTLLVPPLIILSTMKLWGGLSDTAAFALVSALLIVYAAAGIVWARRHFLRAQDTRWTGGTISLVRPNWLRASSPATARGLRPIRALFGKEFRLQESSFLIMGLLLLSHFAVVVMRGPDAVQEDRGPATRVLLEFWWVLWLALPLLVGSSSTAEERWLGTHEAQLSLPATRRTQFAVKFGVVLFLGIFMGGIMPVLVESIGVFFGANSGIIGFSRVDSFWPPLAMLCAGSAWITLFSLYASAAGRNTLQGIGLSVGIGFALTTLAAWALSFEEQGACFGLSFEMPLVGWIGAPLMLAALIVMAFYNYRKPAAGWNLWLLNMLVLVGVLAFTFASTAAIQRRSWEWFMPIEPRHGPVQLSGEVSPQIHSLGFHHLFVLLPDGRLWTPKDYETRFAYHYHENIAHDGMLLRSYNTQVPKGGTFIGSTNWVDIASNHRSLFGIQADGTLWNLHSFADPERIGTDSDWKSIDGGSGFFVALKNDGTVWGWGNNHSGQLGPGPKEVTGDPVQIGAEADWAAVYASESSCTGVKKDGSVWKWGYLPIAPVPEGWAGQWQGGSRPVPIRWPLNAVDWRHFESGASYDLIIREDGTLWGSGRMPRNLLGHPFDQRFGPEPVRPVRVGNSSGWTAIDRQHNILTGIESGRPLFQRPYMRTPPWMRDVWRPSRQPGWIAITTYSYSEAFVALAADGTLSLWGHPAGPPAGFSGLLSPSRKPLWSVNILANTPPE
jgi:hypothetical protein